MKPKSNQDPKRILLVFFGLIVAFGCGKKEVRVDEVQTQDEGGSALPDGLTKEQAAKVLAKIGERTITVGELTAEINKLSPYLRKRWAAPEKRREFLEKLIRLEVLSQEAERQGLTNHPEVARAAKQEMGRMLIINDLEKNVFPQHVDEKELRAEYEKDFDQYHRPEQVRASQIVVRTKAEAKKILRELKASPTDGQLFREKVDTLSIDKKSVNRGGDLGYFSRPAERRASEPEIPPQIAEAVFKLQNVGDISNEIVKTDKGYHIVKLIDKRPVMNRSFASVKKAIEDSLLKRKKWEAFKKFIQELRNQAKIEVFEENLAKLEVKPNVTSPD